MPCAPAALRARGSQPLSWSSCAASRVGVRPGQVAAADTTAARYCAGTVGGPDSRTPTPAAPPTTATAASGRPTAVQRTRATVTRIGARTEPADEGSSDRGYGLRLRPDGFSRRRDTAASLAMLAGMVGVGATGRTDEVDRLVAAWQRE